LTAPPRTSPRPGRLRLTLSELRGQLIILAIALWTVAAVNAWTPDRYLRSGQLKGTDFVHFYTLASLAARGDAANFADFATIDALQSSLVPEAAERIHPPVYGPQVALALSPLGRLSYERALLAWTGTSTLVYLTLVVMVSRSTVLRSYVGTVLLGAVAFPPFWQLLQHGQLSVVAVCGIVGAYYALAAHRAGLAGVCLGLLAYKPSLFAPVLLVLAVSRSWRMAVAAAIVGVCQILVTTLWIGWDGVSDYVSLLLSLPGSAALLAAKPAQMHSLRTFWELVVPWPTVALVLYGLSAAGVLAIVAASWNRTTDWSLRMAMLLLATVLLAPHLYVYDLVILAPAWIWLIDWFVRQSPGPRVARLLHLAYLAPLAAPFVPVIRVQLSVLCVTALLVVLARWITTQPAAPAIDAR
jgi:hypothetical protein